MPCVAVVLRKIFPRVIKSTDKRRNHVRYVVDTRKRGEGRRLFFETEKAALAEARRLAIELPVDRALGFVLSKEDRAMAHRCIGLLASHSRTLEDATTFYINHLNGLRLRLDSLTVEHLSLEWFKQKKEGKQRLLRKDTLDSIEEASKTLVKHFGPKNVAEVSTNELVDFLEGMNAGHQRRFNVRSLFSQFFNWCIQRKALSENPLQNYRITIPKKEPAVLSLQKC
jgi:hypothetical protein